jgi:hypothetical protein
MFKIATIINNDLQELKDEVNKYCSRNPYVVDVDIFQQFTKPRLTEASVPNSYVAVIKYTYNLRGD